MIFGKLLCGAWFLRFSVKIGAPTKLVARLPNAFSSRMAHFWGRKSNKSTSPVPPTEGASATQPSSTPIPPTAESETPLVSGDTPASSAQHTAPAGAKPLSLYPASIIGCAMTARGEIGFLISSIAESNKIFFSSKSDMNETSDIFLIVTWAIVLCTILGPLAVGILVRRVKILQQDVEKNGRVIRRDILGVWGV